MITCVVCAPKGVFDAYLSEICTEEITIIQFICEVLDCLDRVRARNMTTVRYPECVGRYDTVTHQRDKNYQKGKEQWVRALELLSRIWRMKDNMRVSKFAPGWYHWPLTQITFHSEYISGECVVMIHDFPFPLQPEAVFWKVRFYWL